jgi:hypothetical protein
LIEFLLAILSSLLAGFLSGFLFFYFSARSLRQEAEKLRDMVNILARGMESHDLAKFTWDKSGNVKGVVHFLSCSINAVSSISLPELTVEKSTNSEEK